MTDVHWELTQIVRDLTKGIWNRSDRSIRHRVLDHVILPANAILSETVAEEIRARVKDLCDGQHTGSTLGDDASCDAACD